MIAIQNIHTAGGGAMPWFFFAAILGVLWLVCTVVIKAMNEMTIKKLNNLRRNGYTQEFKQLLHKSLISSMQSEEIGNDSGVSTFHKKLLKIYKEYLLSVNSGVSFDSMIVFKAVTSFKDCENVKIGITLEKEAVENLIKDAIAELDFHLG